MVRSTQLGSCRPVSNPKWSSSRSHVVNCCPSATSKASEEATGCLNGELEAKGQNPEDVKAMGKGETIPGTIAQKRKRRGPGRRTLGVTERKTKEGRWRSGHRRGGRPGGVLSPRVG